MGSAIDDLFAVVRVQKRVIDIFQCGISERRNQTYYHVKRAISALPVFSVKSVVNQKHLFTTDSSDSTDKNMAFII